MVSGWRTRLQTRNLEGGSTPPSRPKSVVAGETLASAANHFAHTGVSKAPPATIDRWQPIFKPRYDEVMVWYLLQDDVGACISASALIVRIFRPATGRHPVIAGFLLATLCRMRLPGSFTSLSRPGVSSLFWVPLYIRKKLIGVMLLSFYPTDDEVIFF